MEDKEKDLQNPEETMQENEADQEQKLNEMPGEVQQTEEAEKAGQEVQEEETEETGKESKSRIFGKKKDKKDKKTEQIEELTDKLKRSMAEFDNYRKRTDKEKAQMYEIGAREVIEKMLPVVDNFERGFSALSDEQRQDSFVDGMDKVFKQMLSVLEEIGVTPIESVGQTFDPNFHNAVMHVEDEELGENIVAEEFQKGYLYKETVIRHSMVKVAN